MTWLLAVLVVIVVVLLARAHTAALQPGSTSVDYPYEIDDEISERIYRPSDDTNDEPHGLEWPGGWETHYGVGRFANDWHLSQIVTSSPTGVDWSWNPCDVINDSLMGDDSFPTGLTDFPHFDNDSSTFDLVSLFESGPSFDSGTTFDSGSDWS